jgi:hypothetical protein
VTDSAGPYYEIIDEEDPGVADIPPVMEVVWEVDPDADPIVPRAGMDSDEPIVKSADEGPVAGSAGDLP